MTKRVRTGSYYCFIPAGYDRVYTQHYQASAGDLVQVVRLPGAPPPNTMGQCHIASATEQDERATTRLSKWTGVVLGMVDTKSLTPVPRKSVERIRRIQAGDHHSGVNAMKWGG
jgi:hypothetical protein